MLTFFLSYCLDRLSQFFSVIGYQSAAGEGDGGKTLSLENLGNYQVLDAALFLPYYLQ